MAIIQLRKCSQGIWKVCIHCIWFILQEPINDNCFEYLRCQTSKKRHRQTLIFEKKHGKPTAGYQGGHHREQVCNQRKICQQMVFFFKMKFWIDHLELSMLRGCRTNFPFFTNTHLSLFCRSKINYLFRYINALWWAHVMTILTVMYCLLMHVLLLPLVMCYIIEGQIKWKFAAVKGNISTEGFE